MEQQPAELLGRVTRFLGVSDDARYVDPELLSTTVNPTGRSDVPANFRVFLEDLFAREIDDWKRMAGRA